MAKANITQYSATPSENTDIDDINIDEGCPASNLNNALRSLLSHLKNVDTGSQALTALSVTGDLTVDTNTLKVDSTNNRVGILEASPQAPLHITTGANTNIMRFGADARWGFQRANSDNRYLSLSRAMNGTPSAVMVVDGDNGNVGISNTSPDRLLVISGGGSGAGIDLTNAGGTVGQLRIGKSHSGGANGVIFKHSNSTVGTIDYDNSSTAYNTSSDYRLKENLSYDFNATTRLKQLKPARFNFKIDADKTVDGFLAHEVSSIVPEAISGEKDAVDADGNPIYQGIDQSKLVPLLTKALQEQQATIEALTARIVTLENA